MHYYCSLCRSADSWINISNMHHDGKWLKVICSSDNSCFFHSVKITQLIANPATFGVIFKRNEPVKITHAVLVNPAMHGSFY